MALSEPVEDAVVSGTNLMGANTIRVLIAEDHLVTRVGIASIVNAQPDMATVAEATNGRQAVTFFRETRPDVALIDMRMPVMSGFEAVALIRNEFPGAHLLALSTYDGQEDVYRACQAGVRGYLTKDVLDDELIKAIRKVYRGVKYFAGPIAAMIENYPHGPVLSARELEVLELIVPGLSNRQIATALGIAEFTVKNHVRSILSKLAVDDRTQAATTAIQRGIVHLR